MIREYLNSYINTIKTNKSKLIELKQALIRYKLMVNQFGQKFLDESIYEVKKEKAKENMDNLEAFLAYEQEIKNIVWNKHAHYVSTPIKEIDSKDIDGLAKKYNTTPEVAQIIVDFNITDAHNAAIIAQTILRYNLKDNPNALDLARIIFNKELFTYPNTVTLAEIILKFNLKDNPDVIKISHFIMDNNLKDNSDALNIYNFITNNNLNNTFDAVQIANMVCKLGISLDLAMEVSQYNHENYNFKQQDEKYVFHKLRQLYQIKMKTEPNLNMQKETERIMRTLNVDSLKAKYLLVCCMGNNWGRNSSYYWDYNNFKEDFANNNKDYSDDEVRVILGYTRRPTINSFARGFEIRDGKTNYSDGNFSLAMTNEEIMERTNDLYMPLYKALNKHSLSKDVIVFRGASIKALEKYKINSNDSEEDIKNKLAGKYQDGGFMSTSVVIEEKGNFLGNEVNFIIDLKSGTPCGDLSGYTDFDEECEILLPPNVTFKVDDVKKTDGKIFVYLTSIPTKSLSYFGNNVEENDETISGRRHL